MTTSYPSKASSSSLLLLDSARPRRRRRVLVPRKIDLVLIRSSSSSLLSLFLFLFCVANVFVVVVDAKCDIHNRHGYPLEIKVLPRGVEYFPDEDRLECNDRNSCMAWNIANCSKVECNNEYACRDAHFTNNTVVECAWTGACQEAYITGSQKVSCGGPSQTDKFCYKADISAQEIWCHGPRSCVSDGGYFMTLKIGQTNGRIHCENTLSHEYACHQMSIHIKYGHQACIDDTHDMNDKGCPVVCVNPWDCDLTSMFFLPQQQQKGN
ncbi:hypothetical protein ACA910_011203 [Epithemia clementina (nom. ined.)]